MFDRVEINVRRIRRWKDILDDFTKNLQALRFVYEIREGAVAEYSMNGTFGSFTALSASPAVNWLGQRLRATDEVAANTQSHTSMADASPTTKYPDTLKRLPNLAAAADSAWAAAHAVGTGESETPGAGSVREARQEMWVTSTQVNFCAKAYPTVPSGHPDAPVLSVLAAFLRNGFLHRSIREQGGAYGGGASHDPNIAAFRFFSYRDPRLVETLTDFDAAITWLLDTQHEQLALEEARSRAGASSVMV